jgi:hypothetical protein
MTQAEQEAPSPAEGQDQAQTETFLRKYWPYLTGLGVAITAGMAAYLLLRERLRQKVPGAEAQLGEAIDPHEEDTTVSLVEVPELGRAIGPDQVADTAHELAATAEGLAPSLAGSPITDQAGKPFTLAAVAEILSLYAQITVLEFRRKKKE